MKIKINNWTKTTNRRKVNIQIDSWDTWNMDRTLALIIHPMLIQLRDTKHGVPGELVNDVGGEDYSEQESFDFYKETHKETWEIAAKRWDEILDKMIWSFGQLAYEDYDAKYHHGRGDYEFIESDKTYPNPVTGKIEKTFQMINKNPDCWYDHVGHQKHEERIQEGLDLFGQYFRNLWD
jgi:uncharacterized UPF0160 family protein